MTEQKAKTKKLTPKQERFCREYVVDLNATQAAMRAGYSKKTAYSAGQRLLKNVEIQKRLSVLVKARQERTGARGDEAMQECRRIALADVIGAFNEDGSIKPIHEIPEDLRRAISGFEVAEIWGGDGDDGKIQIGELKKVKFWSKDKQIEMLFKHHGLFEQDNSQKEQKAVVIVKFGSHKEE